MAVQIMAPGGYHSKDLPGYQPQLKKANLTTFSFSVKDPQSKSWISVLVVGIFGVLWNTPKIFCYVNLVERGRVD